MKANLLKNWEEFKSKAFVWLKPEPETKEGYIERQLINLRHDFTHQEQNEIIFTLAQKLNEERLNDMSRLTKEYEDVQNANIVLQGNMKLA